MNKIFEPHEAHIPFILQFFIDFNLYGMSFIEFSNVKYRKMANAGNYLIAGISIYYSLKQNVNLLSLLLLELHHNIPEEAFLPVSAVSLSQCEIDVLACDIINRPLSQGLLVIER